MKLLGQAPVALRGRAPWSGAARSAGVSSRAGGASCAGPGWLSAVRRQAGGSPGGKTRYTGAAGVSCLRRHVRRLCVCVYVQAEKRVGRRGQPFARLTTQAVAG